MSRIATREEMREGIYTAIKHSYESVGYGYVLNETKLVNQILSHLYDDDVVIKADNLIPRLAVGLPE